MKKSKKIFLLTTLMLSLNTSMSLAVISCQQNRYVPNNKRNHETEENNKNNQDINLENDKNENPKTDPIIDKNTDDTSKIDDVNNKNEVDINGDKNTTDTKIEEVVTDVDSNEKSTNTDQVDTTTEGNETPGNKDNTINIEEKEEPKQPETVTDVDSTDTTGGDQNNDSVENPGNDVGNQTEKDNVNYNGNLTYNSNNDISPVWNLENERNIQYLNSYDQNNSVFTLYNSALSKRTTNVTKETFNNSEFIKYKLLNSKLENKILSVEIISNFDLNTSDTYKLKYSHNGNETKEIDLTFKDNQKRVLVANIPNIESNYQVRLLEIIKNGNQKVDFTSSNEFLVGKEIWKDSDRFKVTNDYKWTTYKYSDHGHSFSIDLTPVPGRGYTTYPSSARLVWITKDNRIEYPDLSINRQNGRGIKKARLEINFNDNNVKKIIGVEVKGWNENDWKALGGVSDNIRIEGASDQNINSETFPSISRVEKENNNLKIYLENSDQYSNYKNVRFEIKSTNPFIDYSNTFNAENNGNYFTLDLSQLPKNIEELVITRGVFDQSIFTYPFDSKVIFKNYSNASRSYNITKFDIFKDQNAKKIYGSIAFDFTADELNRFNNKSIELIFKRKQQSFEQPQTNYWNLFLAEQKVVVPFDKWNKFNLNGFYEEQLYTLKSIRIIESLNLKEVVGSNAFEQSIQNLSNKDFSYKFDYGKAKDDFLYGNTSGETKDSLLAKDTTNSKTIEYSIQNHYATINYEREKWYKAKVIEKDDEQKSVELQNDKFTLTKDGNKVNTHFISPRELINNLKWKFNDDFTETTITKDLSSFKNIESHDKDAIITLGFEFDPKQREVTDLVEMEPFLRYEKGKEVSSAYWPVRNVSKSFVYISVPYGSLKENTKLEDLSFEYLAIRNTKDQEQRLKNLIASRYTFSAELNSENKLTFKIKSKEKDTKIFERLGDHYLSLNNSAFLGNSSLFVYYSDAFDSTPITYEAIAPKDIKTTGLNQLNFRDNYIHQETTLDGSSVRLYKENNESNIENARNRTFNFDVEKKGEGTWAVLGKVNPNNPNDYRFYVSTNQHVWGRLGWIASTKTFENPRFDTPTPINEPSGGWSMHKADVRERYVPGIEWNDVKVKVDLVTSFDNDTRFPDATSEFKNNYGDINNDSKWRTFVRHTSNSLSRADMIIGIADFKDIFNVFEKRNGIVYYHNKPITEATNEKEKSIKRVYDFFEKWREIKTIKPSIHNLHLSVFTNLNWTVASFPVDAQYSNHDTNSGKRYREYLIGNLSKPLGKLGYPGASTSLPMVKIDSKILDLNGGSSGTMMFDSEGNATSLYTETDTTYGGSMVIDTQGGAFIGDGKTPQNPGSFYERMRVLSHLYPELYDHTQFNELPNWIDSKNK
ncbi:hypothetical protein [Mycoplasma sp. OR1901]|uniref:hypothetical protein n=1 Tax=Mycoplasma sp. OR1901 TaxID=2742195 RepID=UPI00158237DE|nr:hypothetical protein [Mycoplasma sp. OR1901]QKT05394.1 hypothetical protein HTZ87_01615 [Mycoplasma sp. OR1901]